MIVAILLMVTASLFVSVMAFMVVSSSQSASGHLQSAKALFVAESGLERGIYGYKNGTFCTSLALLTPPSTVGEGDFSITGTFNIASIALGANITMINTIIPVTSAAGFASHGRIRIENEDIDYGALSTFCAPFVTPACFTGARRGVAGSTAAAHNTGATVNVAQDECVIRSTGTVTAGNAQRVVEKGFQNPGAMIVYSKNAPAADRDVPFFRRWDGTNWGTERQATNVGGDQRIRYMVLKFARMRNEAILGTLQQNGDIEVQVWNGNTQTWSAVRLLATVGAGNSDYRGFDIEYETLNDRAIVVFNNANNRNPAYQIWNGVAWTATVGLDSAANLNSNYNSTSASAPIWIELAANPLSNSNEIVLLTLDASGSPDVYGVRWTGTAWARMIGVGPGPWDTSWDTAAADAGGAAVNPSKVIDVAYEQLSGRAMFIWGDNVNGRQRYRIWDGAVLAGIVDLDMITPGPPPDMTGQADWIRLVAQPASNNLMYGIQDENRDLFTANWNGATSTWGTLTNHDTNTEDRDHRNFDIVFETNLANAGFVWLMWGSRVGADFSRRCLWNGAVWCAAITNFGDDAAMVQLAAHPTTGVIFAGIYQDSGATPDDITVLSLTGGVWSAESVIWGGPTVGDPVHERVYVAPERYGLTVDWREIFP